MIAKGCTHIFLEKPGAPSVGELEEMAAYAEDKGVAVYMGYNKNVTKYVTLAREFEAKTPGAVTTFIHNNAYGTDELGECFERNSEGMLKNMAVHELALLVTYYGVTADTIESVVADKEYSNCLTIGLVSVVNFQSLVAHCGSWIKYIAPPCSHPLYHSPYYPPHHQPQ